MVNLWHDIDSSRIRPDNFIVVVEIPKGSKKKYELDKESGAIILDRILHTSTQFPANYGFIPRTFGEDKGPLDVLVLCSEPLDPLVLVQCYPIGVMTMKDGKDKDEKIIAIPFGDPAYNCYSAVEELPAHLFNEMSHFYAVYKHLEGIKTTPGDVHGRKEAMKIIAGAIAAYDERFGRR